MNPEDVIARLLNPAVIATMIAAGVAYGALLWSFRVHPASRLWAIATLPGAIFILVVWSIRGLQGTLSAVYVALLADWLIFATAGFLTVLVWRRWNRRRSGS